jgi:DNA-binding NarL/FixJ family response regulator
MIKKILEESSSIQVVGEAANGFEVQDLLRRSAPDMVLLDITMPGMHGLEALQRVKAESPRTKVLILTMHKSKHHIARAFEAGADGYLLKENTLPDLVSAIEKIRSGGGYLSDMVSTQITQLFRQKHSHDEDGSPEQLTGREREILQYIFEGKSSKEIAEILSLSVITVYNHRTNIKNKLGIRQNIDLFKYGIKHGYINSNE